MSPIFTASTCAMLVKLKYAMNWAMSRKRNSSPASPAHDFVIVPMMSALPDSVPAPRDGRDDRGRQAALSRGAADAARRSSVLGAPLRARGVYHRG
jgi:hypothetical protein